MIALMVVVGIIAFVTGLYNDSVTLSSIGIWLVHRCCAHSGSWLKAQLPPRGRLKMQDAPLI